MNTPKFLVRIDDGPAGTREQLLELLDKLKNFTQHCIWYAADIDAVVYKDQIMSIKLSVIDSENRQMGKVVYNSKGYSIEYKPDSFQISYRYYLMYDTLAIVFDAISRDFFSFDDYSPKESWNYVDNIEIPKTIEKGKLIIIKGFEEETKEYYDFVPRYEHSKNGLLKIKLCEDKINSKFYQIAQDLIVEMCDYKIISIVILKFYFVSY